MSDDAEATQDVSSQAEREVAQAAPVEAAAAPDVAEAAPAQVEPQPAPVDAAATQPAPAPLPAAGPGAPTPAEPASARYGRTRSIAVGLFFFLTCLSLILATTTWWLHDTVLETDRFVALTAELASNPEVQAALVESTVTQVDEALGLGPVGSYVVAGIAREVYASDAFARIWEGLMRVVHSQVVEVLRGDSNLAQVEDGQIVVNLFPVIDVVLEKVNSLDLVIAGNPIVVPDITNPDDPTASREELSAGLGRELKPTFGVIPIAPSDKLETAQRYVTIFDALTVVLWVITGLLALLTLALARRRLRMVALLGTRRAGRPPGRAARHRLGGRRDRHGRRGGRSRGDHRWAGRAADRRFVSRVRPECPPDRARRGRWRNVGGVGPGAPGRRVGRRHDKPCRRVVPGARRARDRPGRAAGGRLHGRHAGAGRSRLRRLARRHRPVAAANGTGRSGVGPGAARRRSAPAQVRWIGPPVSRPASGASSPRA